MFETVAGPLPTFFTGSTFVLGRRTCDIVGILDRGLLRSALRRYSKCLHGINFKKRLQ